MALRAPRRRRPHRARVLAFPAMPHRPHLLRLFPRLEVISGFEPWRPYRFIAAGCLHPAAVLRATANLAVTFALDYAEVSGPGFASRDGEWIHATNTHWQLLLRHFGLDLALLRAQAFDDLRLLCPEPRALIRLGALLQAPINALQGRILANAAALSETPLEP